jgi:hypothetical protein
VSWVNRISNLFRRNQVDDELEEELQFHLDARTRDYLSAGLNAEAAQREELPNNNFMPGKQRGASMPPGFGPSKLLLDRAG